MRMGFDRYDQIFDFIGYQHLPPWNSIKVDEQGMFGTLSELAGGRSQAVLVDLKRGRQNDADPKHVFPFIMEKYGALEDEFSTFGYDLYYYTLDTDNTRFELAAPAYRYPVAGKFGDKLELVETAYGDASGRGDPHARQVPSGQKIWLVLHWRALDYMSQEYKASVRLVDSRGHTVTQADNFLASRWHLGTSGWQPGEDVLDYYLLPVEPGTVPAEYSLEVKVYAAATQQLLPFTSEDSGQNAVRAGTVAVIPALSPAVDLTAEQPMRIDWGGGIQLLGIDGAPGAALQPDDTLELALLWQKNQEAAEDVSLDLNLTDANNEWPLLKNRPVGGDDFPTGRWRAGEMIRQWLQIRLAGRFAGRTVQPGHRFRRQIQHRRFESNRRPSASKIICAARRPAISPRGPAGPGNPVVGR